MPTCVHLHVACGIDMHVARVKAAMARTQMRPSRRLWSTNCPPLGTRKTVSTTPRKFTILLRIGKGREGVLNR